MNQLGQGDTPVPHVGTTLRAPKTAELIANHLRRRIVTGELAVGETLSPEAELVEHFGVSRPTLREAFRILETESLIGVRRGSRGGARVMQPDPSVAARHVALLLQLQGTTLRDVHQARLITEPVCAGLLAARRTKQDLVDLRASLATWDDLLAERLDDLNAATWSRATWRFHELILKRCGNKTLAVQGEVLADIVAAHVEKIVARGRNTRADIREDFAASSPSYQRFIELVEARDREGAEAHWRRHLEAAEPYLWLDDDPGPSVVDLFG